MPLPDSYYYLGGGSVGGPIVRNKTFFWFSTESYKTNTTRNVSVRMPTDLERAGDFSQTFDARGNLVVIYDPLTTRTDRGDGPARAGRLRRATTLPAEPDERRRAEHAEVPARREAAGEQRPHQLHRDGADHRSRADVHRQGRAPLQREASPLSGFYLYNRTDEPDADYFEPGLNGANRFADPNDYILKRRPQMLAINGTWIPGNNSVVTLRYGWTTFPDNNTLSADFDPATLGFASSFVNALPIRKFPAVSITDYNQTGRTLGAIAPNEMQLVLVGVQRQLLASRRQPHAEGRRRLPQGRRRFR